LRLFLRNPETGKPLGSFRNVDRLVRDTGKTLHFAMNAGMYHADRSPVGHYIEEGREIAPVVARAGPGNFGLLPNGIFCIREGRADVMETRAYLRAEPSCLHATQSGPMLVIDGALHPRFLPGGKSTYIRNGVGSADDGRTVWFVISDRQVNFHSFARFFRDHLGADQALYLDGNISRLHAPVLGRSDGGLPMGPIVGVVGPGD